MIVSGLMSGSLRLQMADHRLFCMERSLRAQFADHQLFLREFGHLAHMFGFIHINYFIQWRHPDASPLEWKRFCLLERHERDDSRKINGRFLTLFAPRNSRLYLEGVARGDQVLLLEFTREKFGIESALIANENIGGWDSDDCYDLSGHLTAWRLTTKLVRCYRDLSLDRSASTIPIEMKRRAIAACRFFVGQNHPQMLRIARALATHFALLLPKMEELAQLLAPIEEKYNQLDDQCRYLHRYFINSEGKEIPLVSADVRERETASLIRITAKLKQQQYEVICKTLAVLDAHCEAHIERIFPGRTASMVTVLEESKDRVENSYLIAGGAHLREPKPLSPSDPESLSLLYRAISSRRDVVLLAPHCYLAPPRPEV